MSSKITFLFLMSCCVFASSSNVFGQSDEKLNITITKNDKVIIDTVINGNISEENVEDLIELLTGEKNGNSHGEEKIIVKVIRKVEVNETDSLAMIKNNSENIEIIVNDNQNGTEIVKGNNSELEIEINKEVRNENGEETIIIKKEISEE